MTRTGWQRRWQNMYSENENGDSFRFAIVTGMSGAGKTSLLRKLEDIGFCCVDNLPPALIPKFAELCRASASGMRRVAVVTDVRGGSFFEALPQALEDLTAQCIPHHVIFLEASDDVLVRRYSESRRRHPLAPDRRVEEGIEEERRVLAPIRECADIVIDTTAVRADHLLSVLEDRFHWRSEAPEMGINVFSFGYKYGIPRDADVVIDVRFLPNPFYVKKYKHWSGRTPEVAAYMEEAPVTEKFLAHLYDFIDFSAAEFAKAGKSQFTIAVGCTGGLHRSVFVTEKLGAHLRAAHGEVNVEHRDLRRNHVERDGEAQ